MTNGVSCTLHAMERPVFWIAGVAAVVLLLASAALLWWRMPEPETHELIARTDAINDCKAALAGTGTLVGIFDVSALPLPDSRTAVQVTGRALFRDERESVVSRFFRCGYDLGRGGVLNTELGNL